LRYANDTVFSLVKIKMLKKKRQQTIRDLIRTKNISSQNELAGLLSAIGFFVNQSSVSRDLDEIRVIKTNGFYALPEVSKGNQRFGLLSLSEAGEILIVAKCESGLASAVAVKIDNAEIAEIIGTIAGDDTIFIAVENAKLQKTAIKKLWDIFEK